MSIDHVKDRSRSGEPASALIMSSPSMRAIVGFAERAGSSDAKVLITGESGVGKDRIASLIHDRSPRRAHPFVAVNCAGLTESLLESELFGHVKGSFTGAYRDKVGKLQQAHRGTLFLDEIGEMSLRMQALLLRFLENGEIQAVGSDTALSRVDVRVVAATNRNLPELIAAGQFREDLWYRLRVIHLHVPPLRERIEDIRPLAAHFVSQTGRRVDLSDEALRLLERYRWPGNVRELQNVIEQTVWLAPSDVVKAEHLPGQIQTITQTILPVRERRTQVADELYQALVVSGYSFWEHIYPLFLSRDITRHDMRELVRRGLAATRGNYRTMLKLFGMLPRDYKRFLNFLAAHDCRADFREFRNGTAEVRQRPRSVLPPLRSRDPRQPDGEDLVAHR
jgi:transcriptional regulator with PAS, ATPase and Fis domain